MSSLFNLPMLPPKRGKRAFRVGSSTAKAEAWSGLLSPRNLPGKHHKTEAALDHKVIIGLAVGMGLMLVILWYQLMNLQLVNGQRYRGLADGNRLRSTVTYAQRGRILDRRGIVLAQNVPSFQLVVTPYLLPKTESARQQLYDMLAQAGNMSAATLKAKAEAHGLDYAQPILIKENIRYKTALLIDEKLATPTGFSLDAVPIRKYKSGAALSAVLGYVARVSQEDLKQHPGLSPVDFIGKEGVEASYDNLLRGQNGVVQTEVDAMGHPIRTLAERPTQPGKDIVLGIDYEMQKRFTEALKQQMKKAHVTKAAGAAIDPHTGEVLALVSLPSYNDNLFSGGISQRAYQKLITDVRQPLVDKAMSGSFPSGSIIKPLHLSGALQEGVVNPQTVIVDRGKIVVPSVYNPAVTYTFNGWNLAGLGPMTARRAIAMSSDIYFYTVGGGYQGFKGMGVDRLTNYYQRFGLGRTTGIDLPGETAGLVPTPAWKKAVKHEDWFVGDTYNISIGQGDLRVSPLQMAVGISAITNGGKVLQPHVFKQTGDGSQAAATKVTNDIHVSPQNLKVVREGMLAVIGGTTSVTTFANVPVRVAGKSGTAETDTKNKAVPHAWYVAFAPYEKPRIVFSVILENGFNGSAYAAPAIARAMEWYFRADQHHKKPTYNVLGGACSTGC